MYNYSQNCVYVLIIHDLTIILREPRTVDSLRFLIIFQKHVDLDETRNAVLGAYVRLNSIRVNRTQYDIIERVV